MLDCITGKKGVGSREIRMKNFSSSNLNEGLEEEEQHIS